jgi:hypothetical protein
VEHPASRILIMHRRTTIKDLMAVLVLMRNAAIKGLRKVKVNILQVNT